MQAKPGTKEYGALSLAVQYYAAPEIVANVPPNCFMPRPTVGSAVIKLARFAKPPVEAEDDRFMFALIRAAFTQRRKMLVNALAGAGEFPFSRQQTEAALENMGISTQIRGEKLSLAEFAELANLLCHS